MRQKGDLCLTGRTALLLQQSARSADTIAARGEVAEWLKAAPC
jgi:hypothetical protein